MKPIALAADHGGYELKNHIAGMLQKQGLEFVDYGVNTPESVDYPEVVRPALEAVQRGDCRCALLFCGTGVGVSIAANKTRGIRACCCSDIFSAEMTRRHNDANALCLGGRVVGPGLAEKLVAVFLNTEFEGGRHAHRVELLAGLETAQQR